MGTLVIKSRREASEWRVTQADMCLDSRWAQKSPEETHRSRLHGSRRQAVDPSRDVEMGALVGGWRGVWEISWVGVDILCLGTAVRDTPLLKWKQRKMGILEHGHLGSQSAL